MKKNGLQKIVFVFLPPLLKISSFNIDEDNNVKYLDLDSDAIKSEKEDRLFLFQEQIRDFVEKKESFNKLVIINYPENIFQLESIKKTLTPFFDKIKIFLIIVTITKYELIDEIQEKHFLCPICKELHTKREKEEEENFFCLKYRKEFQKELAIFFSKENIDNYFKNNKDIIQTILSEYFEFKVFKTFKIEIFDPKEVFQGFLHEKIISLINDEI